jgi:hypothetical protein
MKTRANSANPLVLGTVLGLFCILCLSVLVGCATKRAPQTETLSNQEFRFLYPRRYYDSASWSEKQELDSQMQEKAWEEKHKR